VRLGVSLCFVAEVISYAILHVAVLRIMEHDAGRKLKQIEMLLFHCSAIALHCVLGHDSLVTLTVLPPPPPSPNPIKKNIG